MDIYRQRGGKTLKAKDTGSLMYNMSPRKDREVTFMNFHKHGCFIKTWTRITPIKTLLFKGNKYIIKPQI